MGYLDIAEPPQHGFRVTLHPHLWRLECYSQKLLGGSFAPFQGLPSYLISRCTRRGGMVSFLNGFTWCMPLWLQEMDQKAFSPLVCPFIHPLNPTFWGYESKRNRHGPCPHGGYGLVVATALILRLKEAVPIQQGICQGKHRECLLHLWPCPEIWKKPRFFVSCSPPRRAQESLCKSGPMIMLQDAHISPGKLCKLNPNNDLDKELEIISQLL